MNPLGFPPLYFGSRLPLYHGSHDIACVNVLRELRTTDVTLRQLPPAGSCYFHPELTST